MAERETPPARRLTTFLVDADDADVVAYEPIFDGDMVVGFCTSGGYAHYSQKSVAIGFLPRDRVQDGAVFDIEILGQRRRAVVHQTPLFDADASRMRG
jgi:dimethylglycine dehydrogenase